MTMYKLLEDGRIEMTKPSPDRVEMFTVEDLKSRHTEAINMTESFKAEANEVVDVMTAINASPDIDITITDIPEKIK